MPCWAEEPGGPETVEVPPARTINRNQEPEALKMQTHESLEYQIDATLDSDDYDLAGIVADLKTLGVERIDDLPEAAYWEIVQRHYTGPQPEAAERFAAELAAAIAAPRAAGAPAFWRGTVEVDDEPIAGVTVAVVGAARNQPTTWPQPLAKIEIKTPHTTVEVDGETVQSLEALWSQIEAVATEWAATRAAALHQLRATVGRLELAEKIAREARAERDAAIRAARKAGVSNDDVARTAGLGLAMAARIAQ